MDSILTRQHPEVKLLYKVFKGDAHNEYFWAKRLDIPLIYLFGKEKGN